MKLVCTLAAAGILMASSAVSAPATGPQEALAQKAEACLKARAPEVATVTKSMSDGVSFLVDDLCAGRIEAYSAYQRNAAMLASMQVEYSPLGDDDSPQRGSALRGRGRQGESGLADHHDRS